MADVFEEHRGLLFTVAYELLGSVADAEDVVQDAWLRWSAADRSDVADPKSYLIRIASRLALNRMRTLRTRRETYVGPWLPEPLLTSPDASADIELAEDVSMAMLVVLETLAPLERAVFVLREVFGLPYAELATTLGRSEASVRQVAHRAREHVQARQPRYQADPTEQREVTERFLEAALGGDLDALMEVLAPDVVIVSDHGGKARANRWPVSGADKVSRLVTGLTAKGRFAEHRFEMTCLNGGYGVVGTLDGVVDVAGLIEVREGRVARILAFRNPDRMRGLQRVHRMAALDVSEPG
ncbi:RNA polymerase ECF family sigma subunit [Haloactinopolyspora alba]|uniref:RNA polymerase ECF family sigma subunit n=1 Tax=Haloactinopolyspora alba TaxID=648780 RepID=A0A2P8EGB9_9ACTN|nr:RNA polymerase sigma-70 factor [Haloactinopolyspora alba]PSL08507.1 RNA polymerase ECF family sigma subunit [Haloactinopolyspora alba]